MIWILVIAWLMAAVDCQAAEKGPPVDAFGNMIYDKVDAKVINKACKGAGSYTVCLYSLQRTNGTHCAIRDC
jgi:hypothetical protein